MIGSDSGKIAILEFSAEKGQFERVHAETYGKTGCRRVVPGQYVAADPRGRAVMVGGVEKQKLVYILNRDSAARLTISSPLEAHKTNTLCFAIVGADVGFDNPIFATLEVDCEEVENDPETNEVLYENNVVFYELDLGLNHVVRKWADAVDPTSNHLVAIPGGTDGPGGVLVCSENFVMWKAQGHADRRCALPRRRDLPADHGLLIVTSAGHRQKDMFFILVQSEMGDLYKVTLRYEDEAVHEVRRAAPRPTRRHPPLPPPSSPSSPSPSHHPSSLLPPFPHPPPPPHPFLAPSQVVVRYLDTIPVATSLCILKSGFLFGATESGNHGYYQVQGLGDDDDAPMCTSAAFEAGSEAVVELEPRPLRNLLQVDEMESLCPLMDAKLLTRDGTPSLVALCGKSARSTLRTLTRGLAVAEMAVSELPGNPNAVWTVKKRRSDAYDAYIVVSFVNATLVLSIGETVEEVTDSGLKSDSPTVHVALVGDDSIVQVYPSGIRHIRTDGRVNEWRPPRASRSRTRRRTPRRW